MSWGKSKILYKDKAGNKLYGRFIKSRNKVQLSVKNKGGRTVNEEDSYKFINKAKRSGKLPWLKRM